MASSVKNVWDAALQEVVLNGNSSSSIMEKYVLFLGGKSSGKTTALLKFLAREDAAKPTTALEYTFARKTTNLQQKLTGHIWELGGGTNLSRLLDVPLNADTIKQMTIFLVLDLSEPSKLWFTAETLLKAARDRFEYVMKQASKQAPSFSDSVRRAAWERIGGKDRNDVQAINPFPVPLVIIGSKLDLFQTMDPDKKKIITKCLRYLAHANGASLLFVSSRIELTLRGLKHVMGVAAFDGELNKTPVIDDKRPLYVPCGMDSIDAIGSPPLSSSDIGRSSSRNLSDLWRMAFCGHFPQEEERKHHVEADPAKDAQFREPKIDELRAQKDKELEAFKKHENQKWTARIN